MPINLQEPNRVPLAPGASGVTIVAAFDTAIEAGQYPLE